MLYLQSYVFTFTIAFILLSSTQAIVENNSTCSICNNISTLHTTATPTATPTAKPTATPTATPTIVCFGCTTKLMMYNGTYIPIDEIRVGDKLLSFDNTHVIVKGMKNSKRHPSTHSKV